jgi:hypothetical protein
MKKHGKNKSLISIWGGPFLFVNYLDGKDFLEQDERGCICVIKGHDGELWDRPGRDLQVYYVAP